ncbi:MAG: phospholipase D-like domain-containing protein [Actinomycetota bacterium]|jgi:cardiolipin synthase|nr:phospholipase D-like domain-containing protein [Actinomycetota bacterium]
MDELRENDRLNKALARASDAPLREGNRLGLLLNGPNTYDEWLAEISGAEKYIHLENYIFRNDGVGGRFAEALSRKASESVPVRVLYDWFGCLDVPRSFWRDMRSSGVEVRAVNPPTLGSPFGATRRDHRKLLVVDGEYGSTGGICIEDGWLVTSPDSGLPYRDTAVGVRGSAVADIDRAFAEVWNESGEKLPDGEYARPGDIPDIGDKNVRIVIQEPSRMRILRVLQLICAGAQDRIWIADAYFLSMPVLTQALMSAAKDGVDVRVLVPATNDLPWIGVVSRTGYRQFLESGIRIFEYGGPMMHAKTTVVDGWWSRVGSTNLNVSSLTANWEMDLVAEDKEFGGEMERAFEDDLSNAREIRLEKSRRPEARPRVRPEARIQSAERRNRRVRRNFAGSGGGAAATAARVGSSALQKSAAPLDTHENTIAAAVGAALLAASLLGAKFPKAIAWPISLVAGVLGGLGIIRAVRSKKPEQMSAVPPGDGDPE